MPRDLKETNVVEPEAERVAEDAQRAPDPTPAAETREPEVPQAAEPSDDDAPKFKVSLVRQVKVPAKDLEDKEYEHVALDLGEGPVAVSLGALDRSDQSGLDDEGRLVLDDEPVVVDEQVARLVEGLPFAKVEAA